MIDWDWEQVEIDGEVEAEIRIAGRTENVSFEIDAVMAREIGKALIEIAAILDDENAKERGR